MLNQLTERESSAADKLVRYGLLKAGLALKSILSADVALKSLELDVNQSDDLPTYCSKQKEKVHLLKTELVGDLKGFCHLIFSENEVSIIQNTCLPEQILINNNPETRLMKLEFMTEIDNMVAGAVITQLSNHLEKEVYGNVPSLHIMQADEVNKYVQSEAEAYGTSVALRAVFSIPALNVEAEFLWLMREEFIDSIKLKAEAVLAMELA